MRTLTEEMQIVIAMRVRLQLYNSLNKTMGRTKGITLLIRFNLKFLCFLMLALALQCIILLSTQIFFSCLNKTSARNIQTIKYVMPDYRPSFEAMKLRLYRF